MRLPDEARRVVESDALAHVTTIDPDGRPQTTLAWVGLDGDEVVFATLPDQRKLRNLRRDPRVTISIQTDRVNPFGLHEYVVLYGNARVTEGGDRRSCSGSPTPTSAPTSSSRRCPTRRPGYVTRVTVDRIGGLGPWNAEG